MTETLMLSLLVISSFGCATLVNRYGVPRISTYVIMGVIFSKSVLGGVIRLPELLAAGTLTNIALGIIAFLIGIEIKWKEVRSLGKVIFWGTFGQILGAVLVVSIGLLIFTKLGAIDIGFAPILILGAIAATTAPAGTLGVIDEYRAKGTLTSVLLGIVILDDAIGVVVFELLTSTINGGEHIQNLLAVLKKIGGASFSGILLGVILGYLSRIFTEEELRFPLFMGFILLCTSMAHTLGFSPLIACMFLGFVTQAVSNQDSDSLILPIKHVEEFIFIIFFVLAGLHFDFVIFKDGLPLLFLYILFRGVGKYFGALLGSAAGGCSPQTMKLIGLGLLPQAGVAIGLALSITQNEKLASHAPLIFNVVLGSTIFYEIIGPILTKISLVKAGEIKG